MKTYALPINKSNLALITMLNSGVAPLVQRDTWYVFQVEEDGTEGYAEIMSKRMMLQTHDITGRQPYLLSLKKI